MAPTPEQQQQQREATIAALLEPAKKTIGELEDKREGSFYKTNLGRIKSLVANVKQLHDLGVRIKKMGEIFGKDYRTIHRYIFVVDIEEITDLAEEGKLTSKFLNKINTKNTSTPRRFAAFMRDNLHLLNEPSPIPNPAPVANPPLSVQQAPPEEPIPMLTFGADGTPIYVEPMCVALTTTDCPTKKAAAMRQVTAMVLELVSEVIDLVDEWFKPSFRAPKRVITQWVDSADKCQLVGVCCVDRADFSVRGVQKELPLIRAIMTAVQVRSLKYGRGLAWHALTALAEEPFVVVEIHDGNAPSETLWERVGADFGREFQRVGVVRGKELLVGVAPKEGNHELCTYVMALHGHDFLAAVDQWKTAAELGSFEAGVAAISRAGGSRKRPRAARRP